MIHHLLERFSHSTAHLQADSAYCLWFVSCLRRIAFLDMYRIQELGVPLRRERDGRQERKCRCNRERGPLRVALPPGPVHRLENRKNLSAADSNEGNNWCSMTQRYFDVLIAPELTQFVSVAIKRESAANAFGKQTQHFVLFE